MKKTVPGFIDNGGRPMMAYHTFQAAADGQLEHLVDGNLRATVPPEGWESYVEQWPDAAEVVASLRKPTQISAEQRRAALLAELETLGG